MASTLADNSSSAVPASGRKREQEIGLFASKPRYDCKRLHVGVKGGCLVTLTLADKSALSVKLDQVVAIRPLYSANAPQASVEIKGGAQPYEGLDIFVGDNDAVRRVGDALEFMRQSCDPSAKTGF